MINSYLIKNNNFSDRLSSSSGGIFISLSKYFISIGGIVCGVKFSDDFNTTEYSIISTENEIKPLLGSKYMDTKALSNDDISKISSYLSLGKKVLFVGRPCQIYSIKKHISHPNLYCCAISCFGVPEDSLWYNYKKTIEREHNSSIISVEFRNKIYGWNNYAIRIAFDNGDVIIDNHLDNEYIKEYLSKKYLKSKCLKCKFDRDIPTGADIQIGDAWGLKRISSDDDMGTSVCIAYGDKGDELVKILSKTCYIEKISGLKLDILKKYNGGLRC